MRLSARAVSTALGFGVGLLFLAYGCAGVPQPMPPALGPPAPPAWSGVLPVGPALRDTTAWWLQFDDPVLDRLIREALRQNYDILTAAARVDAAAAQARLAGAQALPNLSAGLSASRRRQNLIGIPIPGFGGVISTRSTSFGVSLDVLWEMDLWGRIRAGKAAAVAELQASWADLAGARLSVAGQTAKAWFAAVESRAQLDLARRIADSYKLTHERIRARYERGLAASSDLRLAETGLLRAQALLQTRSQQYDSALRQLEALLGRYPAASMATAQQLPSVEGAVPACLPSKLLLRRPDLLAAERRYSAAVRRVSEARRAFFPRLSLTGSAGTLSDQLRDLVKGDFAVWSIAAGLTQPIFEGGRLRASLAFSHALADQALAQYAQATLRAFAEVESALFAEQALVKQEAAIAAAAAEARAAKTLAERQYRAGLVDYLAVLEAERAQLDAESQLLSARRARLDARVNLHLALGGGFRLEREWRSYLEAVSRMQTEESFESAEKTD